MQIFCVRKYVSNSIFLNYNEAHKIPDSMISISLSIYALKMFTQFFIR